MSQTNRSALTLTRRTMLAGTAASAALAGLGLPTSQSATAAVPRPDFVPVNAPASSGVCANHHRELAEHLSRILRSAHVDERMRNTVLRTTNCPHCKVAITPDMMMHAAA